MDNSEVLKSDSTAAPEQSNAQQKPLDLHQFYSVSRGAYVYLMKGYQGEPLSKTVSAIYAKTDRDCHICVVDYSDEHGVCSCLDNDWPEQFENVCQYIPVSKTKHIWGDLYPESGGISWREGTGYLRLRRKDLRVGRMVDDTKNHYKRYDIKWEGLYSRDLPTAYTFHSQPTNDFYSDIPSVEDIYVFLRYRHQKHIILGRTSYTIFDKTEETLRSVISLYEWEKAHQYERARLRKRHPPGPGKRWRSEEASSSEPVHWLDVDWQHQAWECNDFFQESENGNELEIEHRYIAIALRHIGLKWSAKLSARRREWPSAIRKLGIAVSQGLRYY